MKVLRKPCIKFIFLFITGMAFLNLSFFLVEVTLLKLDKNDRMIVSITKVITSGGFEEECDHPTESDKDTTGKSPNFYLSENLYHHKHLFLIAQQRGGLLEVSIPASGYSVIFTPPPEC